MEEIPVNDRMYFARSRGYDALFRGEVIDVNGYSLSNVRTVFNNEINNSKVCFFNNKFHEVLSYDMIGYEEKRQSEIIDSYCLGKISYDRIILVSNDKCIDNFKCLKYLLVRGIYYARDDSEYILHNIISIPRELFLLEWCIMGGSFDILTDEEFDLVIDLYNFSDKPVVTIDYDELLKFSDFGLIKDDSVDIIVKIENSINNSKKTLRRIREKL